MAKSKPKAVNPETVVVGNTNVPSYYFRVHARKYNAMKKVLLEVFPPKDLESHRAR